MSSTVSSSYQPLANALADRYRIERPLGQGGMATVYLAHDLKHDRKVAVKVLKPELAAVLGGERFVVEIKTTAALQHPHILPLFDSGAVDGFLYYVMPFIDGETLRSKLNRETQFGVDEALRIAVQVADALDYAHRHGVIHRDIKPENILLHDGRPMVADFGIALALSAAAGGRMTETGLSLGTPHYMSPEQATAEKEITGRSDIYSLASVLYEMLAGAPPHVGGSAQQIIMRIIADTPRSVTDMRKSVPPHVAAAIAKALEKVPADRFATAKEFADALGRPDLMVAPTHARTAAALATPRTINQRAMSVGPWVVAAAALVAAGWGWMRPTPAAPVVRVPITMPDSAELNRQPGILLAMSADGSRIVYVGPGEGDVDLWERPLNSLVPTHIPETNGADSPFLSPDGDVVAFYRQNPPRLFTASLRGGPRQTWAQDSTIPGGGDFAPDGAIYFTRTGGIRRVRTPGGPVEEVTKVDAAAGEQTHAWPDVLPNGKGLIFTIGRASEDQYDIAAVELPSGKPKVLVRGTYARYSPTGHLVYADANGGLFAIPFDASSLEIRGAAIPLVSGVSLGEDGVAHFVISERGQLLYLVGGDFGGEELLWVDRAGRATPVDTAIKGPFVGLALSPDGRQLAMSLDEGGSANIWLKDLPNGPLQKVTLEGDNYAPSWSPDGRTVRFLSDRKGLDPALYEKRVNDGTNPVALMAPVRQLRLARMSNDGAWIVYSAAGDIFARRVTGDTATQKIIGTTFGESVPALSPDGKWLAYVSVESGRPEVYVSPFPNVASSRTAVSIEGGSEPRWSANGREIFYSAANLHLHSATVELSPTFRVLARTDLFDRRPFSNIGLGNEGYDVSRDGQRFLMFRARAGQRGKLVLVLNWPAELAAGKPR